MAEGKNSIVVYADWIDKFEELSDEEAGILIKHFFRYVNDLNPVLEDRILKMAFHDIEKSLKRDLKKWEKIKGERSESGILGNLKRWHRDLFDNYSSNKITLNEALLIAENRKTSLSDNSDRKTSQTSLLTVSVNDSVINKVITKVEETLSIDANKFISYFNSKANRNFKLTNKVKIALKARTKNYSNFDIKKAIDNAHLDKYHLETNFKYLTPEFILREEKLEKFINQNSTQNSSQGIIIQNTN